MRTIDITTTQNVTIQYTLASTGQRIGAFVLDAVTMFAGMWILALAGMTMHLNQLTGLMAFAWMMFFSLGSEAIGNGRSLGKRAMGIRVVKADGGEMGFTEYFLRWSVRFIDIWFSIGTMAALLCSSTEKGQRLGDVLANTTCIRVRESADISVKDLMRLRTSDNYQPVFPQVRNFREEDMLFVKGILISKNTYRNSAHREALAATAERMAYLLELDRVPADHERFLNQVLSDYIVLTR